MHAKGQTFLPGRYQYSCPLRQLSFYFEVRPYLTPAECPTTQVSTVPRKTSLRHLSCFAVLTAALLRGHPGTSQLQVCHFTAMLLVAFACEKRQTVAQMSMSGVAGGWTR